ncbi:MAG: MFS transporter [Acidimicrobiales bacterium]
MTDTADKGDTGAAPVTGDEVAVGNGIDSRRAWLVVIAAFFSSFISLGIAYSFGAFFSEMAADFDTTKGATAVIFGITTFAFFWLSLITGRAADVWGPRPVLLVGAAALLIGLVATSRVDSLTVGYVTYGAGVGIAAACGYIPMVAAVGGWFIRSRATAVGLAVAGIGAGTLVMSPVSATLIERYGWRDTFVILGVGGSAGMVICSFLAARPPNLQGPQPARFGEAFRSPIFRRLHLSGLCSGLALFVPFVFVGQYAKEQGAESVAAAVLVGVLGGASVLARIGFGGAVRRFGSVRLYRSCFVMLAAGFPIWLVAGESYGLLVVFVIVLGVGYGGFVALSTIVLAERFGVVGLGSVMGLFYTSQGLGGLIGPPTAGWLIDETGGYATAIVICCGLVLLARALLIGLPVTADGGMQPEPS